MEIIQDIKKRVAENFFKFLILITLGFLYKSRRELHHKCFQGLQELLLKGLL